MSLDCQEWLDVQCLDQVTKVNAVLNGNPYQNYRVSLAIWDHTKVTCPRHKRMHPALTPAGEG